jgi:hypothetical protein
MSRCISTRAYQSAQRRARRDAQELPVRRAVASSAKTSWVDKGFREVNRMAVHPFPVAGQCAGYLPQQVRRQPRTAVLDNTHPENATNASSECALVFVRVEAGRPPRP